MIQTYIDLIPPQNKNKSKFIAWLTAVIAVVNDIQMCLSTMYSYFDLDNAVGTQLDSVGVILGVDRLLNFQPTSSSSVLSDDNYRLVLMSKILTNQWDGTRSEYEDLVSAIFESEKVVIQDNQDMSINIAMILDSTDTILSELLTNGYLVPAPSGVLTNYIAALKGTWDWYYYQAETFDDKSSYTWDEGAQGI